MRERAGVARAPREQLLVSQQDGELEIGLFVAPEVLAGLATREPVRSVEAHLHDFLLTVEGVSHFVYLVWRARADQSVSALELELQAEVDKYVTCLLVLEAAGSGGEHLRRRLFEEFELA